MLVLCDFDGTITTHDVTNLLWDAFGLPAWRDHLLPPYRAGLATTLELMDRGWSAVAEREEDLLVHARARTGLRTGFERFVALGLTQGWRLHVVSCGLDWYLRAFLPPGVAFTCYAASRHERWRVSLPSGFALPPGADFKIVVAERLARETPDVPTVLIGDGRNDFPLARRVDRVYALAGSALADLCRAEGVPCVTFSDFDAIAADLVTWPRAQGAVSPVSA